MSNPVALLFGSALSLMIWSYSLFAQEPQNLPASIVVGALAVVCVVLGIVLWNQPRLREFMSSYQTGRWNFLGPVNLPTVLWSLNAVLIASGVLSLQLGRVAKLNEGKLESMLEREDETLSEIDAGLEKEKYELPAGISLGNQSVIAYELQKAHYSYKIQVYRELTDHCITIGDQLYTALQVAKWKVLSLPEGAPTGIRMEPGIHIYAPTSEPPWIGAARLMLALREAGLKVELQEDDRLHDCDCIRVTIAELKHPTATPTPSRH